MKPIIAPTDFSPASLNAVNYAADMACNMKTSLHLLHTHQLIMPYNSEFPVPIEDVTIIKKETEEKMEQLKKELIKRINSKINIYTSIRVGAVINELEDYCASVKPYAVVMGTRGTSALERVVFGSHTIAAMKHLPWPLLAVPPEAKFAGIKKIGLTCDLKMVVETIPVQSVRLLVKQFGAKLHIIHINSDKEGYSEYKPETIEESAFLQEMLDEFHPSFHFINTAGIEEAISIYAETHHIDLLIIIPKKHTIVEKLFHRSRSKQLILHTHIPIMSIHENWEVRL
jgi:nucleotide-binding universal stress UspA family protein